MGTSLQVYIVLLLIGLFLLGAEIYLPGGVIGFIGVLALIGAVIAGFYAFGAQWGFFSAVAIIVLSGLCIVIWIKYFPRTGMGKKLTLSRDGKPYRSAPDEFKGLIGKEGIAQSHLRPSGMALVDGRRIDVVAEGSWIPDGMRIRIVAVEGNRVIVRPVSELTPGGNV